MEFCDLDALDALAFDEPSAVAFSSSPFAPPAAVAEPSAQPVVIDIGNEPSDEDTHDMEVGVDIEDLDRLPALAARRQPAIERKREWRSAEAMEHARLVLQRRRQKHKDELLVERERRLQAQVASVRETVFSDSGQCSGAGPSQRGVGSRRWAT